MGDLQSIRNEDSEFWGDDFRAAAREYEQASYSGLMREYSTATAALVTTKVEGLEESLAQMVPMLGRQLRQEGSLLTYVNLINAAHYAAGINLDPTEETDLMECLGYSP